jgi:hypothetical protein
MREVIAVKFPQVKVHYAAPLADSELIERRVAQCW